MPIMRFVPLAFASALVLSACGRADEKPASGASDRFPSRALAQLRWIEGAWKGVGAEGTTQEPFYKRYKLKGDSTLVVVGYRDSSLQIATDTTLYSQRGDSLTNPGPGPRWIAASVSADSILFVPLTGARNRFVWRRGDDTSWIAILDWPPVDSLQRHRVYRMVRIK